LNVENPSDPRLPIVLALLRSQSTIMLSTCDDAGWPQATPLFYYADDDLALYWFSSPRCAHSEHISRDPRVGIAVSMPTDRWREIRGLQMRGEVSIISDDARRRVKALFCRRFDLGATFRLAMTQSRLFRFRPSWIRYIDNTTGIGDGFEITCAVGRPAAPL